MDWKLQLGISIVVPIVSSLLTYLAAIKKSKNDVEAVKISAETEIKKIREESDKELKRIQKETMKKYSDPNNEYYSQDKSYFNSEDSYKSYMERNILPYND